METETAENTIRPSRLLSSKNWTRSWLLEMGVWIILFTGWWYGPILGELFLGWFGTLGGPEWIELERGAGFILFFAVSFLFLVSLDRHYGERLPVLANRPKQFEWISFVIFLFTMITWFVTLAVLTNTVAAFGDGTGEMIVASGSLLLFLSAATALLLHISR